MSDLVDAVARAIFPLLQGAGFNIIGTWEEQHSYMHRPFLRVAQEAIDCLHRKGMFVVPGDPTKAMLAAGSIEGPMSFETLGDALEDIYRAMVAAAPMQGGGDVG